MRRLSVAATLLVGLLTLSGCTATSGSSDSDGSVSGGSGSSGVDSGAPDAEGPIPVEQAGGIGDGADPIKESADGRSVITEGYLTLTVDSPLDAVDDAARIVERAGGRVDSRSESPENGDRPSSASLTVRIPSEKLTATLDDIEELGRTEDKTITATDVTAQTRDLTARITALRASVDRLLALLSSATATADLVEIETALSSRQAELESLEASQRALGDQISLSTVQILFGTEDVAPVDRPDDFLAGIVFGFNALIAFFGTVAIAAGVALPWLVIPIILILIGLEIFRRKSRNRAATKSGTMEE